MADITEITVESFVDFIQKVKEQQNLIVHKKSEIALFRGQTLSSWNLQPGLGRVEGKVIPAIEKSLLIEFKRRATPFLPSKFNSESDYEWLALAQHYKLPTRLLDWTENPLIALYFAFCQEVTGKKSVSRAVWHFYADSEDLVTPEIQENPFDLKRTMVYKPNQITQRITNQSGWFTIHKYVVSNGKLSNFDHVRNYKGRLVKFILPEKIRLETLEALDQFGINSYSIYPDLEGLSMYLKWKLYENS